MVADDVGGGRRTAGAGSLDLPALARSVPLRLTAEERALLAVLEQALLVSEYTDHVDVAPAARRGGVKTRRILEGILEVAHTATGLAAAAGCLPGRSAGAGPAAAAGDGGPLDSPRRKKKNGQASKKTKSRKDRRCTEPPLAADAPASNGDERTVPVDEDFLQTLFEIGRRNKVLNPNSMRTTYGKLMYLLQDAQNATVARSLGFSLHREMLLCGSFLEARGAAALLRDPRLECAVQYVADRDPAGGRRIERAHVEALVLDKQRTTQELVEHYTSDQMTADDVRRVVESLADAVAYIQGNLRPLQCMLRYLEENFDPHTPQKGFSLTLKGGGYSYMNSPYSKYGLSAYSSGSNEGPKLSHSHDTQYTFVWQSLRLWCKVQQNMHRLWLCADDDLLSTECPYHLYNTGQGLNRVQQCPRVRRVMQSLLSETQQEAGSPWVGLSVIHLGDRDVPNALIFIDKYTYIPRFLAPIVLFLQTLPELCHDERIDSYVQREFGSQHKLMMTVLTDYFKHGFDGSGDDGGSCIDGRLTSSWNWTSRIAKKAYYHAFMLSGFQGFDGDWK